MWDLITQKDPLSADIWDTVTAQTTSSQPEVYVSDIFALTGQNIYINFSTPNETPSKTIVKYITHYNSYDLTQFAISKRGEAGTFSYDQPGTYYISYDVVYNDGSIVTGTVPHPLIIKSEWTTYSQEEIRTLEERILNLPYTLKEIEIQPNEWGDADIFNSSITKLYNNFKYLENNIQSINTDSPTVYFGWLGLSDTFKSEGIRWFTEGFGGEQYKNINVTLAMDYCILNY